MAGIVITGIGAVTPVGLSAPASAAAFRASVSRMGALANSEVHGPEGSVPLPVGGRVPLEWFNGGPAIQQWPGHERFEHPIPEPEHLKVEDGVARLARLAVPAALESYRCARSGTGPAASDWGLYLGIGTHEPNGTAQQLVQAVIERLGQFHPAFVDVLAQGRAAGLAALHRAAEAVKSGKVAGAIVGGVDSLIRPATHTRLATQGSIRSAENPQGVLPGEAAGFLVIEKQPRTVGLAVLAGTAVGEESTAGTDKPNQGEGLTAVIRAARAAAPISEMPLFVCDLNGERYRAMEWGLAYVRALGDLKWRYDLPTCGAVWHPADCIGDCGAASGLLNCIWAIEAFRRGYALCDRILVWGASDGHLRAAAILAKLV